MSAKTDMGSDPGSEVPEEGPVANLFLMLELFDAESVAEEYREEYRSGEIQYGYLKQDLAEVVNDYFEELDRQRTRLDEDESRLDSVLDSGKQRAREVARETLDRVKKAMNLG